MQQRNQGLEDGVIEKIHSIGYNINSNVEGVLLVREKTVEKIRKH